MPRQPSLVVERGISHEHNRAARGWPILEDEADASPFNGRIRLIGRRDGWASFFASCLPLTISSLLLRSGPVPMDRGRPQGFQNRESAPLPEWAEGADRGAGGRTMAAEDQGPGRDHEPQDRHRRRMVPPQRQAPSWLCPLEHFPEDFGPGAVN
jgi:hypothetical protein